MYTVQQRYASFKPQIWKRGQVRQSALGAITVSGGLYAGKDHPLPSRLHTPLFGQCIFLCRKKNQLENFKLNFGLPGIEYNFKQIWLSLADRYIKLLTT